MADLITLFGALVTLAGFLVLVLFIRRLGILEMEAALIPDDFQIAKKEPQPMVEVKNPFEINVSASSTDISLLGYLKIVLKCSQTYNLSSFWKVQRQLLEKKVLESESASDHPGSLQEMLQDNSKILLDSQVSEECCEKTVTTNIREILARSPNEKDGFTADIFDLVVLVELTEQERGEQYNPCSICAMVVGVHLKRDGEHFRPHVVERYIQSMNGKLFKMKKLFLEESSEARSSTEDLGSNLCIVCQLMPISRALIPCGHACLCVMCFDKVNTCPMCRHLITSSFILREEPNLHDNDNSSERLKLMNPLEIIRGIFNSS